MKDAKSNKIPKAVGRYELVAFLTGFSLLVLEITGGRLIAPYFGASTYIWTATIGVILGALAIGTIVGGQKADSGQPIRIIANTTLGASVAVMIMGLLQQPILASLAAYNIDLRVSATLAALILFALPSYLIGVIGPNLAKLNVTSLEVAGRSISRIEAASTVGSIGGTFMTGYFFLGWFGSRSIVVGVAMLLLLVSYIAGRELRNRSHTIKVGLLAIVLAIMGLLGHQNIDSVLADVDTSYARYLVASAFIGDQPVRVLMTDGRAYQSGVAVNEPTTPVFSYVKNFYATADELKPESTLTVGGGTFTFPAILAEKFPANEIKRIDAVEIDPELTDIAQNYFYLNKDSRVNIINQDGRRYLNQTNVQYDAIYMDAFASLSPPFQLTTKETAKRVAARLTPEGVAVVNAIGNYENGSGDYLRAIQATYQTSFKHVAMFQSDPVLSLGIRQNFIMIASNNLEQFERAAAVFETSVLPLDKGGLVLTDNYAPVERLTY